MQPLQSPDSWRDVEGIVLFLSMGTGTQLQRWIGRQEDVKQQKKDRWAFPPLAAMMICTYLNVHFRCTHKSITICLTRDRWWGGGQKRGIFSLQGVLHFIITHKGTDNWSEHNWTQGRRTRTSQNHSCACRTCAEKHTTHIVPFRIMIQVPVGGDEVQVLDSYEVV